MYFSRYKFKLIFITVSGEPVDDYWDYFVQILRSVEKRASKTRLKVWKWVAASEKHAKKNKRFRLFIDWRRDISQTNRSWMKAMRKWHRANCTLFNALIFFLSEHHYWKPYHLSRWFFSICKFKLIHWRIQKNLHFL